MTGYVTGGLATRRRRRAAGNAQQRRSRSRTLGMPAAQPARHRARRAGPAGPAAARHRRDVAAAARTLERVADSGSSDVVMFVLENLNTEVDHPGVPFARPPTRSRWCEAVDNPHLRMMLDLYHAQIGEGNLIELSRRVAVSVRSRSPTCPAAASRAPVRSTTRRSPRPSRRWDCGTVGLEAFASGDPQEAVRRFRDVFTV